MEKTRILFVGGFLGAGKTTLLQNVTRRLMREGHDVGLVTNDQAPELVDTLFLAQAGQQIQEVSGSCFCCNFFGLVDAVRRIQEKDNASIILAEPVGSCTDLSATILQPMKEHLQRDFVLSPLSVVVDAQRLQALMQGVAVGLHPSAEYIVEKQLEEADMLVVNKIDRLSREELDRLRMQMCQAYPDSTIFYLSAKTGEGVQEWLDAARNCNDAGKRIVEVDYDRYAEGEAVLGWLNATVTCSGKMTDWKNFVMTALSDIGRQLEQVGASVGHIKIIAVSGDGTPVIANLTGTMETLDVRGQSAWANSARLTINARAEMSPESLEKVVRRALSTACRRELSLAIQAWQSLSPGRPDPTYRYDQVISSLPTVPGNAHMVC